MTQFSIDEFDLVEAELDIMQSEGLQNFTVSTILERCPTLSNQTPKGVDSLLHQLWQRGTRIYTDAIGEDGTHSWVFGYKQYPDLRRRPIGNR